MRHLAILNLTLKVFFHVLGHTVKSKKTVILYDSEIWGLIPNYKKKLNECSAENYFFKLCNESLFLKKNTLKSMQQFFGYK